MFSREFFKPKEFECCDKYRDAQGREFWDPSSISMRDDRKDFEKVSKADREILSRILKFFTQADLNLQSAQCSTVLNLFKGCPEVQGMYCMFSAIESIHQDAYSLFVDTILEDDNFYKEFKQVPVFKALTEQSCEEVEIDYEIDAILYLFENILLQESVFLFTMFVLLLSYHKEKGLFPGLDEIVCYSIRDETIHIEATDKLCRRIQTQRDVREDELAEYVIPVLKRVEQTNSEIIDFIYQDELSINGIEKSELLAYGRFNLYKSKFINNLIETPHTRNPFKWVQTLLTDRKTDFFSSSSTSYSKI